MTFLILTPEFIINATIILLLSIMFHEFGHWIYIKRIKNQNLKLKWFKGKGYFNFGIEMVYKGELTHDEQKNFILSGIFFGFIPLFFSLGFNHLGYMLLFPLYVAGCKNDYLNLLKLVQKEISLHNGKK